MARLKVKKQVQESFDTLPSRWPSLQDRIWAETLLEELNAQEISLGQRLAKARRQRIATMTKDLETTQARIANIRCFLAPIRTIPEEIISFILLIAFYGGQSPWIFAHVSRSFRIATFNTPIMWNKILFRTSPIAFRNVDGVERCHTRQQLLDALQRSKRAQITVTIELRLPNGGDRALEAIYRTIPAALGTAADRICSLTIVDISFDYYLPNIITKGLKSLQTLHISGTLKPRRCFETLLGLVDRTAPNLQSMSLTISPTFIKPDRKCWQTLTTLVIQGVPPLSVVSQFVNLRSLQLRAHSDPTVVSEPLHSPPFILPSLQALVIGSFPVNFLRSLSLPALIHLKIDSNRHVTVVDLFPPFPSLVTLILSGSFTIDPSCFTTPLLTSLIIPGRRHAGNILLSPRHYREWTSPSKVTKLVLDNMTDETGSVLAMLRHHLQVSDLTLMFVSSTPSVIQALWGTVLHSSSDDGSSPLCPLLKELSIKFRSIRYKQVAISGMLQAMAMARESGGLPLEAITFFQFRHGNVSRKQLLPLSGELQQTESDSDQSTCDACQGYHD